MSDAIPEAIPVRQALFQCMIQEVHNGFILNLQGCSIVIQGNGDLEDTLEKTIDAIRSAYANIKDRVQ